MTFSRLLSGCRYLPGLLLLLGPACGSPDKPAAPPPAAPPAPTRPAAAAAQPAADTAAGQFSWENEVCHNTGYFPTGRYTPAQLRDSYALVNRTGFIWVRAVHLPEQLQADSVAARLRYLDAEYRRQRAELGALRVVPVPYWQRLQRLRLLELDEDYRLQRLMLRAYLAPEQLLTPDTAPGCRPYAEALASADTAVLFRAWRQLVDEQKRLNGYPDDVEARYQEQRRSTEAAGYARVNLMGYGWWNCVNGAKKYGDVYNKQLPENAFERLFTRIVADDCADVD